MNWFAQKIYNVKTALDALYYEDQLQEEAFNEEVKDKERAEFKKSEPVIVIDHSFVIVEETCGGQSFHTISSESDFDEFEKEISEFCEEGYLKHYECETFCHIKKIK